MYDQLRWQSSLTGKEKEEYLKKQKQKDKKNNKKLKNLVRIVRPEGARTRARAKLERFV